MDFLRKLNLRKYLDFLDELVSKIPETIANLLKAVFFIIIAIGAVYGIYIGWSYGKKSASQVGQDLAKDTRTLFKEEIEKEYNRKRKNIRMPDMSELLNDSQYREENRYEYFQNKETPGVNADLIESDRKLLESKSLRTIKQKDSGAPLYDIEDKEVESNPISDSNYLPGEEKPKPAISEDLIDGEMTIREKDKKPQVLERTRKIDFIDKPDTKKGKTEAPSEESPKPAEKKPELEKTGEAGSQ